ncbi:MAG: hypothetical protein AAB451_04180 [Patescibacteria group bacterium]
MFIYEKYSYEVKKGNLEIFFSFRIEPDIYFKPKITIDLRKSDFKKIENLIFHIGLIEMISYWKATCSPIIEIQAGYLNKEQINWWKNLIINGMSQFFYENKIDWRKKDFLTIVNFRRSDLRPIWRRSDLKLSDRYLVPFAGGRDSIITLEGLKKLKKDIILFTVNPIEKIQKVVKASGIKKQIIVRRIIDKKLLELNKEGYLNGHTPFTGLLSFISVLCAVIFNYKNIAFSNEKSADEGNVKYLGKIINHQWAKSSEFEKLFQNYCKKYLVKDLRYFSFTRKYSELEISKILTKYPKYFPVFSSCNAGMRVGAFNKTRWCCNCPKCLFVYMTLYPYLKEDRLLKIFGQDIFENKKLLPTLRGLLGQGIAKPFECVGTFAESREAFKLCKKKSQKSGKIPYLLTKLK